MIANNKDKQSEVKQISMTLSWPPSVNKYWLASGHRRYISPQGIAFRQSVISLCPKDFPTFIGRVSVKITAFPPDKRKRDLDNICKAIFDSLQHAGIYADDFQVGYFSIERAHVVKNGKIELTVFC